LESENTRLSDDNASLKQQLDWFKRQVFGSKSERRLDVDPAIQADLLAKLNVDIPPPPKDTEQATVGPYQRRKKSRDGAINDSGLRFDEGVPVETIAVSDPDIEAIPADQRERIGEKVTCRLAQRPGSYVILRYVRPVYKLRENQAVVTTAAPGNVLDKTVVDVSFLSGLLIDKFCYHLPLHRQHQRLEQSGIRVSRSSLTTWVGRSIDLLRPIVEAQRRHILLSRVLAMDETATKAGRQKKGKMRQAYFWPIYGEDGEIVFLYAPSREHRHVATFLEGFNGTLLTDGYEAYAAYARATEGVINANCWSHCRRKFYEARNAEPEASEQALILIGALYRHEEILRDQGLAGAEKLAYRAEHSVPIVKAFWHWCEQQCHRTDLLPKNPLSKALKYACTRRANLEIFLGDPEVMIDTNHLERGLRPIPMGKKNWMFSWTEIGAERIGLIQSLLVTCRIQGVDPYTYLVDVLQRISVQPASQVIDLTPRLWKDKFADHPMKSDLALARQ
jgi:transposase